MRILLEIKLLLVALILLVVNNTYSGASSQQWQLSMALATRSAAEITNENITNNTLVYQNPVTNRLFIESAEGNIVENNIYNVNGSIVHNELADGSFASIDINKIPNGINFIQLSKDSGIEIFKFLKQD